MLVAPQLVIEDAVPAAACEAVRADMHEFLGLAGHPSAEWHDRVMEGDRGGFLNLSHSQALWGCRQSPRLHQAFAEIHGTEKLWVSQDICHMKLPYRKRGDSTWGDGGCYFGPGDPRNNNGGLHWDVHGGGRDSEVTGELAAQGLPTGGLWAGFSERSMVEYSDGYPCSPQGVLYLSDCGEDGGGFRCCPGFHRRFNEWLSTIPPGTSLEQEDDGHWIRTHKQLAQQLEPEAVTVPARAGSLVVWHRLLPHGNVSRTMIRAR